MGGLIDHFRDEEDLVELAFSNIELLTLSIPFASVIPAQAGIHTWSLVIS